MRISDWSSDVCSSDLMLGAVPRIRYAIPARELVEARFGALADWPERAYEMSIPAPKIERSRALAGVHGVEYWLRFTSPHKPMGDTVWAHVYEPHGVENPPSLVYGHGLGVEMEMLDGASEESLNLLRAGVRRSEGRRVGKEGVRRGRYRWA